MRTRRDREEWEAGKFDRQKAIILVLDEALGRQPTLQEITAASETFEETMRKIMDGEPIG
jgi:hypothetical protein